MKAAWHGRIRGTATGCLWGRYLFLPPFVPCEWFAFGGINGTPSFQQRINPRRQRHSQVRNEERASERLKATARPARARRHRERHAPKQPTLTWRSADVSKSRSRTSCTNPREREWPLGLANRFPGDETFSWAVLECPSVQKHESRARVGKNVGACTRRPA